MSATLVCFDLGNVLVRICGSWAEACAAAGLELRDGVHEVSATPERMELIARHETGDIACDVFFERIASTMDGLYSAEEVQRAHAAWLLGEFDGVGEMVERLRALDRVELACLSNTNASHWDDLIGDGAIASLHHHHASHVIRERKPNADIYAQFERAVGRKGGEILFFDDLAENVEAARRRGWDAEIIERSASPVEQMEGHLARRGLL